MTARRDAGQTSFVPAKVLRRLLQEQPTPFYLYDETMLREACEKLRLAFSWNAGFTPVFPVRMNQNPAVLRILASAGAQMLCASEAELRLARRADADGQRIIYAPVAIDERACGYARRIGAAQLAMHSAFETAGAQDTAYVVRALRTFFGLSLQVDADGTYRL